MIRNSTWKLIRRATGTAAILALVIVLVVIYVRSGGRGGGVGVATGRATNAHTGAGRSGNSSSASGSTPPPPSSEQAHGSSESSAPKSSAGPSGTFTGPVIQTPYGPVQVAVAEEKGRITDVKALQLPTEHPQSVFISERATPLLRTETLEAQSAEISVVSGATFTSEGFASSLQQALLKAG